MAYLFPGRHVFGLIVSACGLPFRKSAASLPLPLLLPLSLSLSNRECIQAAAELSHSPKWSKYFGQLVVCNNCSCHRCCCCCCSYVVAANYDKQQLSEICAGAPAPSGSTSPVLVGALFVANCLWRQRYKQNKRRRCRHKQMQLHAPCPMSGSSAKSGPFVSLPQKW